MKKIQKFKIFFEVPVIFPGSYIIEMKIKF